MTYKGYSATVDFDEMDKILDGRVVGIKAIISFHGTTIEELETNFHESIDHYLDTCSKLDIKAEKLSSWSLINITSSDYTASISELRASPTKLLEQAGDKPIMILNRNKPSAYLVPAKAYEQLIEMADDYPLSKVGGGRLNNNTKPTKSH